MADRAHELAQEYLPARMGLATGLTIRLSSVGGGLVVAALGAALPQPLAASRAPHASLQVEAEG